MKFRRVLANIGYKLFPLRLAIGLGVALVGLQWLHPTPLFAEQYRLFHALALLCIVAGLVLRAWGAGSAGQHTRSGEIEALQLATGGPFAYVRNPIYAGSICIGIGMSVLIGDPWAFLLSAIAFGILYFAIVPAEEKFLARQFGAGYCQYQEAVPRLIPRLRPWPGRTERTFCWKATRGEFWIMLLLGIIYAALIFEEYLDQLGHS